MKSNSRTVTTLRKKPKLHKSRMIFSPQQLSPQDYEASCVVSKIFRFEYNVTNTRSSITIAPSQLCSLLAFGVNATTVVQVFESVKLRRIQMWGNPPVDGDLTKIGVNFSGVALGITGPGGLHTSSSGGTSRPAKLDVTPPAASQACQWQSGNTSSGNQTLFELQGICTGSSASIATITVDIHVALKCSADPRTTNNLVTVAGPATPGAIYYLSLDNNATGAGLNAIKADLLLPSIV